MQIQFFKKLFIKTPKKIKKLRIILANINIYIIKKLIKWLLYIFEKNQLLGLNNF